MEELELAAGEAEAVSPDEGLVLVRADLQLAGDHRAVLGPHGGALAPAGDGLDPCEDLLRMGGLGDPVIGPEAQAADALGDGRALGADDHAETGHRAAELLQVLAPVGPEDGGIKDDDVQLHRHDFVERNGCRG